MTATKKRLKIVAVVVLLLLLVVYLYRAVSVSAGISDVSPPEDAQARLPPTENSVQSSLQMAYEEQGFLIREQKAELQRTREHLAHLEEQIRSLQTSTPRKYPKVKYLNYKNRKRILITGGAGFVGSHLVDDLMVQGHEVIVVDNFFTGRKRNVEHWLGHENFELIHHDIVNPLFIEIDEIYHLASPASPPHYMYNPVKTIKTNTMGTINVLGLAKRVMAKVLIASTSEVYGDPTVHPQPETYWGHVNPIGPRACYDEGKRVSETLSYAYAKQVGLMIHSPLLMSKHLTFFITDRNSAFR